MTENKDHEPAGLDNGFDPKVYPEIWFEQALQQHITPAIRGLKIRHVPLGEGFVAVEPLAKLHWCDEFSTVMSGKRGVGGVLG
jgi:hypothetical protein